MKKLITIAAMAMLVGATVSQAQITETTEVNNVTLLAGPVNIDVKVSLSDKTKPAVTGLRAALVRDEVGSSSGNVSFVIGTVIIDSLSATNNGTNLVITVNLSTNVVLESDNIVDLGKGKFAAAVSQQNSDTAQPFGMSNSAWYVQGSVKAGGKDTTNVSAKIEGIWKEGSTSFKGSLKTSKD